MTKPIASKTLSIATSSLRQVSHHELASLAKAASPDAELQVKFNKQTKKYTIYFRKPGVLDPFKDRLSKDTLAKTLVTIVMTEQHGWLPGEAAGAWGVLSSKGRLKAGSMNAQQHLLAVPPRNFAELVRHPELVKLYLQTEHAQRSHNPDVFEFLTAYVERRETMSNGEAKAMRAKFVPTPELKKLAQAEHNQKLADHEAKQAALYEKQRALRTSGAREDGAELMDIQRELIRLGQEFFVLQGENDGHAVNVNYDRTDAASSDREALDLAAKDLLQGLDKSNSQHLPALKEFVRVQWHAPAPAAQVFA